MQINNNYKVLLDLLGKNLKSLKGDSNSNINGQKNIPEISSKNLTSLASRDVLTLLKQLNAKDRRLLISNLLKYNLPLEKGKLDKFISYLKNNPQNSSDKIKAFTLLLKSNFKFDKKLINGLAANFNKNNSISEKINNLIDISRLITDSSIKDNRESTKSINTNNSTPNTGEKAPANKQLSQILKQLIINPSQSKDVLTEQLKEYPQILKETITSLQNHNNDSNSQKIFQQLIGQNLLNHQTENVLLHLEIPMFFPQYNKLIPVYIHIEEDNNTNNLDKNKTKNYRIDFIISLEKRGVIKAETKINTQQIQINFKCNNRETVDIIESRFANLKNNLEKMGIKITNSNISYTEIDIENINEFTNKESENTSKNSEEFMHIDIKI
ncbi:MAG: flagellar hook-length control protein FliK [Bacillota bacterium]